MNENQEFFLLGATAELTDGSPLSRKQLRKARKAALRRRFSANLVVDLQNTTNFPLSVFNPGSPLSGAVVGAIVDLILTNTYTNVWAVGGASSGLVGIQIQTADVASGVLQSGGGYPISGAFTDPTSGLAQLPTNIQSGGVMWVNSGLFTLPGGGGASGGYGVNQFGFGTNPVFQGMTPAGQSFPVSGNFTVFGSGGGMAIAAFQRPYRYARLISLAGSFSSPLYAGFIANLRTTGSGGGFTFSPQTGSVIV